MNAPPPRALIYQMARVGSISWTALGRSLLGDAEVIHLHYMNEAHLAMFAELVAMTGPLQTIRRRQMLRSFVDHGRRTRHSLTQDQDLIVVTAMRDPVARALSLLVWFADFMGSAQNLSWREGARPDDVRAYAIRMLEWMLGQTPPDDSFSRLCAFFARASFGWFEDEFKPVLGIDLLAGDGMLPARIDCATRRVLLYRTEDMRPEAPAHAALRAQAAAIFGVAACDLPWINDSASRRSNPLFEALRQGLNAPKSLLDAIYAAPLLRRFYSEAEIESFRGRWLNKTA